MGKHGAHSKLKIGTDKKPLQKRKEQGEEMENKLEEPQANKSKEKLKLRRCDSMGHLKPDLKPESHADVPKAVQDENTEDSNVQH